MRLLLLTIISLCSFSFAQDGYLTSLEVPRYVKTSTDYVVKVTIINAANPAFFTGNIRFQVDGGTINTRAFAYGGGGVPAGYGGSITFTQFLNIATEGAHELKVWCDVDDEQNRTNDTLVFALFALDNGYAKNPMLEKVTGTWCGYCPNGGLYFETQKVAHPNASFIANHINDDMTHTNGSTIAFSYGKNQQVGTPSAMVDRLYRGGDDPYLGFANNNSWNNPMTITESGLAPVQVVTERTYNETTRELVVTIKATFGLALTGNFRFNAYLTADEVPGTGGLSQRSYLNNTPGYFQGKGDPIVDWVHHHTSLTLMGGSGGEAGNLPASPQVGNEYTHTFTMTLPTGTTYDPMNVRIVGFVWNDQSGNLNDEILNSNWIYVTQPTVERADKLEGVDALLMGPVPMSDVLNVSFNAQKTGMMKMQVRNMLGQTVAQREYDVFAPGAHKFNLPVQEVAAGTYFVTFSLNGSSQTIKVLK